MAETTGGGLPAGWVAALTAGRTLVGGLTTWISSIDWNVGTVTAAGTLILGVSTCFLWLATRRLVKGSEKTAEHQLRAYVFPESVSLAIINGLSPEITIVFKNCGQTPAYDVALYTTTAAAVYPLPEEPKGPTIPPTESMGHLGPGMSLHYYGIPDPPITSGEITGIRAHKVALYIFGSISYTDAFKKKRFVNFCYFRGGPDPFRDGPMAVYKQWNKAN